MGQGVGAHCCLPKSAWPPTGGAVLELDVIVDGFKTILDTGTTITPRIGPFIGIFPSLLMKQMLVTL